MTNKEFTQKIGEQLFHTLMETPNNQVENVATSLREIFKTHYSAQYDEETFNELVKDMEQCYNKTTSNEVCLQTTFCAGYIIFNILGDRGYVVDEYHAKLTPKRGRANVEKALTEINNRWDKHYTLEDVTIIKF